MRPDNNEYENSLKELYIEQSPGMFRYAKSILRDDFNAEIAVQETWLIAWRKIDELIVSHSPVGWLFNTLKNVMKKIQTEQYQLQKHFVALDDLQTDALHISDEFSADTLLEGIVSKDDFLILDKLYIQGYTYKELADEMGAPLSTIGMRAMRAKEKFRKYYE